MRNQILVLITLCFLITACDNGSKNSSIPPFEILLPDTANLYDTISYSYISCKHISNLINLPAIEEPSDTLTIRIWSRISIVNGGQVLSIQRVNKKWSCLDYTYITKAEMWQNGLSNIERLKIDELDSLIVKVKEPKSGWSLFFHKLNKLNFNSIPSQTDIDSLEFKHADGNILNFEFSNNKFYKFISYSCPDVYSEKHIECQLVIDLFNFFDREFGLDIKPNCMNSIPKRPQESPLR